ncbi:heavy-metal-associated domain-containing protein [Pedobacter boryungensis]|uniref:Heavy-metal-associated domain-containing protein n=1 Tax=Pedobacter boryungensis TaxID=869962 RepID=A0ABX2DBM0_9SPHI|nr:cation transporter [Pedobacter boryungensis]NQX31460.1 heavy-metal-associated domain-containing protein [Pedobacter boryungensis]
MKTIKIIILFLIFFAIKVSAQQITTVEMQVTGLTCSMCSQATEKSLRTLDYVSNVTPDLNKNLFVITFKKDKAVNFDQLNKKVKDAGFSVGKLEATMNFNQTKIDENGQTIINGNVYRFTNAKDKVLNGPVKVNVIDKGFISNTAFKQKSATVKLDSYASGSGLVNGKKTRVYHLSI